MQNNKDNKSLFSEFPPVSTEAWEEKLKADLKTDNPASKLNWKVEEGMEMKAIYRAEDLKAVDYLKSVPGTAPFHRGTSSENTWEVNRIINSTDVKEANKLAKDAIGRGAESIEFNCSGLSKAEDMAVLLDGICLEETSVRFDKAISYKIILKHFLSFIEAKGYDKAKINGSFNWDAMAYRLVGGKYYQSLENNIEELKELIEEVSKTLPNFKVLSVNAQHFHNGGATTTQELAMTLSASVEYTHRLLEMGVSMSDILNHTQFRMALGSAYFVEIAKFRAFRYLWAKAISAFDAKYENEAKAYICALNGTWNKTIFDPYVNMLRTTTETMSAAIAGVDVITVLPFNSVYGQENEFASRIAQNQNLLVKEEAHFDKVADAAGGSYYIENLTSTLIENSWELFTQIEDMGGYAKAMESDFIKNEIAKSREQKELQVATRRLNILGTNQFPNQLEFMMDEIKEEDKVNEGLELSRAAKGFEQLRLEVEKYAKANGRRPKVFLNSFGNLAMRKARAGFISNFFACAGYEIIELENCKSANEGLNKAKDFNADIMVLCSADDEYLAFAKELYSEMNSSDYKPTLLVAGNPKEQIEELKQAGVSDFINVKTNVLECLRNFNKALLV